MIPDHFKKIKFNTSKNLNLVKKKLVCECNGYYKKVTVYTSQIRITSINLLPLI